MSVVGVDLPTGRGDEGEVRSREAQPGEGREIGVSVVSPMGFDMKRGSRGLVECCCFSHSKFQVK